MSEAEVGSEVQVCCLSGQGRVPRRLAEMGFTPGTRVRVLRRAPLADPVEYALRGYLVTLRREEAALVWVKPLETAPVPPKSDKVVATSINDPSPESTR